MKAEGNEISEEKQAVGEGIMSFRELQKARKRKEVRKEGQGIEIRRIGEETRETEPGKPRNKRVTD